MFRFRCQCFGFLFGLLLSMGVSAASTWLPVNPDLGLIAQEGARIAAPLTQTASIPSPLPLILIASGLLALVFVAHRR